MTQKRPIRLNVRIGAPISDWQQVRGLVMIGLAPCIVPFINHQFIGGGWVLDLIGAIIGVMVIISLNQRFGENPTMKQFETADEAAEWIKTFGGKQ